MPIFDYVCITCGKTFEKLQLAGREETVTCTACGQEKVEKKVSAPFLPASVGKPANEDRSACCAKAPGNSGCPTGSCGM